MTRRPISTLARMYQIRQSARAVAETFSLNKSNIENCYYSIRRQGISRLSSRELYEAVFKVDLSTVDPATLDFTDFYRLNLSVRAAAEITGVRKHIIYSEYTVLKRSKVPRYTLSYIYYRVYDTTLTIFTSTVSKKNRLTVLKLETIDPLAYTSPLWPHVTHTHRSTPEAVNV
jgi:hypothetical protein